MNIKAFKHKINNQSNLALIPSVSKINRTRTMDRTFFANAADVVMPPVDFTPDLIPFH